MSGFKTFIDGVPLYAAEINGYLMSQSVMRFATTAALIAALTGNSATGQLAYATNTDILYMYNGTVWKPIASGEKAWSPTWTGSVTNPQKGTSTESGTWRFAGYGLVQARWRFLYNGTFVIGSGNYAWTLPLLGATAMVADNGDGVPLGHAGFADNSASGYFFRTAANVGANSSFVLMSEAGVRSGAAAPVAPAANDIYDVELFYRTSAADIS